eukprot:scaffold151763_cov37-Prasinocladus_malaysianus.AAC.1
MEAQQCHRTCSTLLRMPPVSLEIGDAWQELVNNDVQRNPEESELAFIEHSSTSTADGTPSDFLRC